MRLRNIRALMLLSSFLLAISCNLNRDFNRNQDKAALDNGLASSGPDAQAKGDRPQETGEGLPGYLLDPELLVMSKAGDDLQITGSPRAVRSRDTQATTPQRVLLVGYKRSAKTFRRDKDILIAAGRLLASVQSQDNGSFNSNVRLEADEILFLRLADAYADNEIAFIPGKAAPDRVMLDAATGRFQAFDAASTQRISYDIDPEGTQLAQIATLKATRACRSCVLSGANLAGVNLNGCVLLGSIMIGTDLTAADLRNCQLQNTNLSNANLTGADLSAADLTQANLTNAILTDAILTNVKGYQPP